MSQFFQGILNIFRPAKYLQELTIHDHESLLQAKKNLSPPPLKFWGNASPYWPGPNEKLCVKYQTVTVSHLKSLYQFVDSVKA